MIVSSTPDGRVVMQTTDASGQHVAAARTIEREQLADTVRQAEAEHPRWVWDDTEGWYPGLLAAGVRLERCHDLRLCRAILRTSTLTQSSRLAQSVRDRWDGHAKAALNVRSGVDGVAPTSPTLFDDEPAQAHRQTGDETHDESTELVRQLEAVAGCGDPGRIRLLLAAESVGALVAAEMRFGGLPFRRDIHDRMLTNLVGSRPSGAGRPEHLAGLVDDIRRELAAPQLNPDSQADLLRALRAAGLIVSSTRSWELKKLAHPAIGPLLEYKKLSRLLSANGWVWADTWAPDGRFRPEYVVGGVVTGRWATQGGGGLQLPKQVRAAVVADEGWKLVVADAAQLEPRVLAALAHDDAMAAAGRGTDLYAGIVASGAVKQRAQAKVAMLGAMYGATTGESGRLLPALARAYPRAIALVDAAARAGERGEQVTSRLGRSSPVPGRAWREAQSKAYAPDATVADERRARQAARDWGRFTRNFVVQASAAEWALCWMGELRRRLAAMQTPAGDVFTAGPHLVFFLHDEVIVHSPADRADEVAEIVRESAAVAGRLLFQDYAIDFPVKVAIVDAYSEAG